jgi:hypothetical protein
MLDQPLDGAVLACAVAAFEDDEHTLIRLEQVALQFHELDLKLAQPAFVVSVLAVVLIGHERLLPALN